MRIGDKKVWLSFFGALLFSTSAISGFNRSFSLGLDFLPDFLGSDIVLKVFLLLAGIILLYDSFNLRNLEGRLKITAIATGFLLAFLGAFPLLNQFGMLKFLPFIVELTLSSAVLAGLLLFYSLYLFWEIYMIAFPR